MSPVSAISPGSASDHIVNGVRLRADIGQGRTQAICGSGGLLSP